DPHNSDALLGRAEANAMAGNYSAIAPDAQALLKQDPGNQKAQQLLALAHDSGGAGASGALGQGRAMAPPSAGGAQAASDAGGAASASALASRGGAAGQPLKDAQTALRLGDYALAVGRLSQAIAANPNNAEAYNLRAIAYNRAGLHDLALKD